MIRSFRSKALRRFVAPGGGSNSRLQGPDRLALILDNLDRATRPEQLNIPGLRFYALKGLSKGRYAVWASGNWRITFGWIDRDAIDVDLEEYH
jgi:toxin HigB-1